VLDLIEILLVTGAIACAVYWAAVASRVRAADAEQPHLGAGLDGSSDKSLCVVVPAHNEEGTIAQLIRSLRDQDHADLCVVLALDRCTDRTGELARAAIDGDRRFEVVEIERCPPDWAGKVNAVRTGVERSSRAQAADILCFTDADCVLEPGALRAACVMLDRERLNLLSLLTRLTHDRWFEIAVQPAASFELMRQYPIARANRTDERQRPFANGQFMMFDAAAYRSMGGHGAVKDEVLEDLALGRRCKETGHRAGVLIADGLVRCRMYDTWRRFTSGWKRIYIEGAQRRSKRLRLAGLRLVLTGVLLPTLSLAGLAIFIAAASWVFAGVSALGVAAWLICWRMIHRFGGAPIVSLPFCLFASVRTALLLFAASRELASGVPVRWAGREYVREDRSRLPRNKPAGGAA